MISIATYDAGSARLAVIPDVSQFKAKLEAEMRKIRAEYALHVTADVAQARADVERFRDELQRKGIRIGVQVTADTARAQEEIEKTRREAGKPVKTQLEMDVEQAENKLRELRIREEAKKLGMKVDVEADTKQAQLQLQLLRTEAESRKVTLRIAADTSDLDKFLKKLGDLPSGPGGNALQFGGGLALIGELPAATTAVAQFAGALQQLAGAGLAIPGILAGIGASVGTLVLGLSGIKEAYSAVTKASQDSSQNQAQYAQAAIAASNAHRNAVVDEAQAEKDRTRAWRDATQQLQDLNLQLRGGQISEEQAKNNALRQRRDLQKDLATGQIKDQIDLNARLLDIQAADQSVAEAHQRNIELTSKANTENAKGVAGSDQVVAANQRVTRSLETVQSTQAALDQQAQGSTSQRAAAFALSQLSANGRELVNTLAALRPQFQDFQGSIQDNLLAGVSQSIKNLVAADLPNLKTGMGNIATAWNGILKQLGVSLSSDTTKGFLDRILGNTADAQNRLKAAVDPIVHVLGVLSAAGSNTLPHLVDDFDKLATRFDQFISAADKDGRLEKWINDGITGFEHVGNILLNLAKSFTDITKAAGGGEGLWGTLDKATEKLHAFLSSTEGQNKLKQWFAEGRQELHDLIPILQSLPGIAKGVFDAAKDAAGIWLPVLREISSVLTDQPGLIQLITDAFLAWKTIDAFSGLITGLTTVTNMLRGIPALSTAATGAGGIGGLEGALTGLMGNPATAAIVTALAFGAGIGPLLNAGPDRNAAKAHQDFFNNYSNTKNAPVPAVIGPVQGPVAGPVGPSFGPQLAVSPPVVAPGSVDPNSGNRRAGPTYTPVAPGQNPFAGFTTGGVLPGYSPGKDNLLGMVNGNAIKLAGGEGIVRPEVVKKVGAGFIHALNGFAGGAVIDQFGNPVDPGMLPGPSTVAPIAPNPSGGGILPALQSGIAGLQGPLNSFTSGALSGSGVQGLGGITSLIPGLGGQPGVSGLTPGLAGLAQAGNNPNAQAAWQQQTASYLGNWGGNLLAGLGSAFYTGILGFFGLQNSVLSPSNPWFQDATKSLGILNNIPGIGGTVPGGTPSLGTQSITLGDGSTIQIPTFGTSTGSSGAVGPGIAAGTALPAGKAGEGHLQTNTITGERVISAAFPMVSTIGGWREKDKFPDHPSGQALDVMIPADLVGTPKGVALGNQIQQFVQQNAGGLHAKYTIWQQRYTDTVSGASNIMEDRGSPTANHMDHVHITFFGGGAPTANQQFTSPVSFSPFAFDQAGNTVSSGTTVASSSAAQPSSSGGPGPAWDLIAGRESSGDWHLNTGNGFFGGLQFQQSTWDAYKPQGAPARADLATREQQIAAAVNTLRAQGPGAWPATSAAHPEWFPTGTHDVGGRVPPGYSLVHNATGGDEYILNRPQAGAAAHALQAQAILPTPTPSPQVPDAHLMQPPPAPAQVAPTGPPAPEQGPPPPPATIAPAAPGPAPIGVGQSSEDHLLPAVATGIQSGFAAAGNVASAVASAFGGGMGGGGSLIGGAFAQMGKIATGIANVGASMLVGSVPGSFGDPNLPGGGATLRPAQRQPQTAPLNGQGNNYVFNGIDSKNVVDELRLKDAQDQQALLATSRG